MARLYTDSLGFAAAKMIRRILGLAHVIDLEKMLDFVAELDSSVDVAVDRSRSPVSVVPVAK